ncbi:hypothetical protein BV898_08805 [Hypsibius exemplaris]|uniref:G-protein coupled receptors family 1 profile domain-containing protein n=1 Tax=Hypsibius exemplaris TaxID=2072580 RepID=A0A1W0WPI3_HYPEX|nr:hypothetical protein BV898_08805 [Hypsibius exemplaris]
MNSTTYYSCTAGNGTSDNGSTVNRICSEITPGWTPLSIVQLIIAVWGLVGNGGLFVVFATHRALWTPFNVYVVNLIVANCVCIIVQFPLDTLSSLYDGKWILGETVCTFYLQVLWCLQPIVFNSHQMIAINRIWAVIHPISYRSIHSIRTALCLCAGVWVYVIIGVTPGVLRDTLYFRVPLPVKPQIDYCQINTDAQLSWAVAIQVVYYIWPQVTMVAALVIIFFIKRVRQRAKAVRRSNAVVPNLNGGSAKEQQVEDHDRSGSGATPAVPSNSLEARLKPIQHPAAPHSHGNLLLVLLTISVTICWTPNNVYYTWMFFKQLDYPVFYYFTTILFCLQAAIDPIMFTLALKALRVALADFLSCRRS